MAVTIKSAREIELMREAGRILAEVHEELGFYPPRNFHAGH